MQHALLVGWLLLGVAFVVLVLVASVAAFDRRGPL
jgi:hypothetical protein